MLLSCTQSPLKIAALVFCSTVVLVQLAKKRIKKLLTARVDSQSLVMLLFVYCIAAYRTLGVLLQVWVSFLTVTNTRGNWTLRRSSDAAKANQAIKYLSLRITTDLIMFDFPLSKLY